MPRAASDAENEILSRARALLGAYDRSETMIRAGLYAEGSDPDLDQAIRAWPDLDGFLAESESVSTQNSFDKLGLILRRAGVGSGARGKMPVRRGAAPSDPTGRSMALAADRTSTSTAGGKAGQVAPPRTGADSAM